MTFISPRNWRVAGLALAINVAAFGGSLGHQAPPKARALLNPYAQNPLAKRAGARLYARECAACHGANAGGTRKAPSLIGADVAESAPGALFWVLRNGSLDRGMPSFAHLPEARRWQIISYLRTLRINR